MNRHSYAGTKAVSARVVVAAAMMLALQAVPAWSQQSRESMANDNTASQWSFQTAYQGFFSYRDDMLSDGSVRPEGSKSFAQLRIVAPVPVAGGAADGGVTILPRLTVRYTQNAAGDWGLSPTDLFALVVPFEWATGRFGFGPDVVLPGKAGFGNSNVQFGGATALIQRAAQDKIMFGILVQQVWGKANDSRQPDCFCAGNLIINPFLTAQLGKGLYLATNDLQAQYDWNTEGFILPVGGRLGYVLVQPKNSWNFYVEYVTQFATDKWTGSAAKNVLRLNLSMTIPVG